MPLIVRIPYYIWIGCSRSRDTSRFTHAFEVDGGNMIGSFSPTSSSTIIVSNVDLLDIGQPSIAIPDNSNIKIKETIIDVVPPLRYVF
jgi:betaine lipid synthase